jgi:hypothetical protein
VIASRNDRDPLPPLGSSLRAYLSVRDVLEGELKERAEAAAIEVGRKIQAKCYSQHFWWSPQLADEIAGDVSSAGEMVEH